MVGLMNTYTFLPEETETGDQAAPELFRDEVGIDRELFMNMSLAVP